MGQPRTVAFLTRGQINPADLGPERAALDEIGGRLVVVETRSLDEAVAGLKDVDVVVNRFWGKMGEEFISKLERCRAILQPSTGYDQIDVDAATAHGVAVINLPIQCLDEVVNHALAMLLALNRKLVVSHNEVRKGTWSPRGLLPIGPITGETLGLLGFGNIARETGRRAQVFGLNVIAYDPFVDPAIAKGMNIELVGLNELLKRSDYVSCHLPLNPKTRHSIGEEQFRQMKPSAIFVNTARGPVVDEPALIKALQEGRIQAAGLDVLEQEPPDPANPLLNMENVIVTPHLAGTSDATPPRQRRQVIESYVAYLKGDRPLGLVNPSAWEAAQAKLTG
ncbi:MAG TPA: C-terminal binding protein [Chloroflexota bacterium]|nr:C-terminal binding protein [Chloroflexota bacterium]